MVDNGIIEIKDIHNSKKRYKIISCFTLRNNEKTYLIYADTKNPNGNSIIYASEMVFINQHNTELINIPSEAIMLQIKTVLESIANENTEDEQYELKSIDPKVSYTKKGNRSISIHNKLYKVIKKDYNSNKINRPVIKFSNEEELTIEIVDTPDENFISDFKLSEKYSTAIKNI